MLFGRDSELAHLTGLLERASQGHGAALVVRGEAGIGKTALLDAAAVVARARGMRVVSASGVQAEVHVPYAGLHRVAGADVLGDPDAQPYRVAVTLLESFDDTPVLIAVEDLQWLDPASWETLSFLARRLGDDAVAVVMTARDGTDVDRRLGGANLPELRLDALAPAAAGDLLDAAAPGLTGALRERVLTEAAGNPLGITELGAVAARSGVSALLPPWLPLSTRVERTFAGLVAELPQATRTLLVVAALNDGDDLGEVVAAAGLVHGPIGAIDIEPAVTTRLMQVDDAYRVRFRHPLLRSALHQSATVDVRRRVHAALAEVVAGEDRRVWHRAGAATGPDEILARELTETATRADRQQAAGVALLALERAAQLSESPAERGSRLLYAVETAGELGDAEAARRLLARVDETQLRPVDRARLSWGRETFLESSWSAATRMAGFAGLVDLMRAEGDSVLALESLTSIAVRLFWSHPDAATRELFLATSDRLAMPADDPRMLTTTALIAPIDRGAATLDRITVQAGRGDLTPHVQLQLGLGAGALGATALAHRLYSGSVGGLRAQGRLGLLAQALCNQGYSAAALGDTRNAVPLAAEGGALAGETGQGGWQLTARLVAGHAEALRGNEEAARLAADLGESVLLPAGRLPMLSLVQQIRGVAALAGGRAADAYQHLHRIFDPADDAHHSSIQFLVLGHLAEAATRSGAVDGLREIVATMTPLAELSRSPALVVGLGYANAVLADDAGAFEDALAAELGGSPFERARLLHAYGAHLRRQRRAADSREPLRAAASTFDALGATPWAERAREELRASGETVRRNADPADLLTPQEQQIARLAADGLSNREIAERLYLSPRTVTTHLYRIFPKLGVKSRGELARVLTTIT
ncbi:ATP-binding protein [Winogradskya humida]|uniref:LuxR family transcriptional regulator n=1 Tax=Winogradskya humida TaxID=113566 RepID=A0ABQ3ZJ83_9ACTN|nr:helix-turn-helix transcriptional regulator [Actinoplanes humidus]GIE18635.1 LuxR family transcriptional regulator [Actinoplanes humidus]